MKRLAFVILWFCLTLLMFGQQKVSILGDSYSTFKDWIPEGYDIWYGPGRGNDVQDVSDTWWYRLINDNGLQLELNNSWSGSTICNTGYNGEDYTRKSFLTRASNMGDAPDIIYIFGGTNDSWANSPLGEADGTDMYTVRPAAKAMLHIIREKYPDAFCLVIINSELSDGVVDAITDACAVEKVPYVQLHDIDKQKGHPSIEGMKAIASQVWQATIENKASE